MSDINNVLYTLTQHPSFGKFIQTGVVSINVSSRETVTTPVTFSEQFASDDVVVFLQPTATGLPSTTYPTIGNGLTNISKNGFSIVAYNPRSTAKILVFNWTAFGYKKKSPYIEGFSELDNVLYTFNNSFANTAINFYSITYTNTNNQDFYVPGTASGTAGLIVNSDFGSQSLKYLTATEQSPTVIRVNTYNKSGTTRTTNAKLAYIFKPEFANRDLNVDADFLFRSSMSSLDKILYLLNQKWMKTGIQGGPLNLSMATSGDTTINFPTPFASPPIVRIYSSAIGVTTGEGVVTATGFTPVDPSGVITINGSWAAIGEYA